MKTIMVLGLTYNQLAMVRTAQKMGYSTLAVGTGGGPPVVAGHCDELVDLDFSDRQAVFQLAAARNVAGLVTCGTSTAICTIAEVTQRLGISDKVISIEAANTAVYKDQLRAVANEWMPRGFSTDDMEAARHESSDLRLPLIVKPADGGGGKGIHVLTCTDNLEHCFEFAQACSKTNIVVVEEYHSGYVLGVESLVLDGEVHVMAIADKTVTEPPHCITLGVAFPSQLPEATQRRIKQVNENVIERTGIQWGPTHIDMVIDRDGEPLVIDVGPRLAGGPLMSELVPRSCQYDVYQATIQLAVDELPDAPGPPDNHYYGSRFLLSPQRGTLQSIDFAQKSIEENRILSIRQLIPNGTLLSPASDDAMRVLVYTSSGATHEELMERLNGFSEGITFSIE